MKNLKEQVATINIGNRPWAIWIWNLLITREELTRQFKGLVDNGFGGIAIRPSRDMNPAFLSEEFMEHFGYTLKMAKEAGVRIALATDFSMPWNTGLESTFQSNKALRAQNLTLEHQETIAAKGVFEREIANPETAIVLSAKLENGNVDSAHVQPVTINKGEVSWKAPAGDWKILVLRKHYVTDPNGGYLPNTFEVKTGHAFVQQVLDILLTRFASYVPGVFNTIITEMPANLPAEGAIPWDDDLVVKYRARFKKELLTMLPLIFCDAAEGALKHRSHVYWFLAQSMYERFASTLDAWTKKNRMTHWVLTPERALFRSGAKLRWFFAFSEAAHNAVGLQGQDGIEETLPFMRALADMNTNEFRRETIAVLGRNRMGSATTLHSLKTEIDQAVMGGAHHLLLDGCFFNLDQRSYVKTPCNPFWYSPDWAGMRGLCDYAARLQGVTRGLHGSRPVAVLLPTTSIVSEFSPSNDELFRRGIMAFVKTVRRLQELNIDFDIVSENHLLSCPIRDNGEIGAPVRTRKGNYQALIVPWARMAPKGLFVYFERLAVKKGTLIFIDEAPQGDLDDGISKAFTDRVGKLLNSRRGNVQVAAVADLGSTLADVKAGPAILVAGRPNANLHASHRIGEGLEVFIVRNSAAREDFFAAVEIADLKYFALLDSEAGVLREITGVEQIEGKSSFDLFFAPTQTHLIIGSRSKLPVAPPLKGKDLPPIALVQTERKYRMVLRDQWTFAPVSPNILPLASWNKRIGLSRDSGGYSHYYESFFFVQDLPSAAILLLNGFPLGTGEQSAIEKIIELTVNGSKVERLDLHKLPAVVTPAPSGTDAPANPAEWVNAAPYLSGIPVFDLKGLLIRGANRVTVRSLGYVAHPIPLVYPLSVAGDFSVEKDSRGLIIAAPGVTVGHSSWTKHGFPYMSGKGRYTQVFEVPSSYERLVLRFVDFSGTVEIGLNGTSFGVLHAQPMEIDITKFCTAKRNEISLVVTNTVDNMLRMNNRDAGLIGEVHLDVYEA